MKQPTRTVDETTLGAWLIKGNADAGALLERFRAEPRVRRWCVQGGYRARMMRPGQPVVFWASGSRSRAVPYGVWGLGRLAGGAAPDAEGSWSVPLELDIWPEPERLSREQIRADQRLAGLEVLRQPQGSNPSFLTPAEYEALRDHLGEDGVH